MGLKNIISDCCKQGFLKAARDMPPQDVDRLVLKITSSIIKSNALEQFIKLQSKSQRCCRTIIQSIGYFLVLEDCQALAVGLGYLIGDLFDLNVTLSTSIVTVIAKITQLIVGREHFKTLRTEGPGEESTIDLLSQLLTVIWQAMMVSLGVSRKQPGNLKELSISLFDNCSSAASRSRSLLIFFKNLFKVIANLYTTAVNWVTGNTPAHEILYQNEDLLEKWSREVLILTDAANESNILNDRVWYARLELAVRFGDILAVEMNKAGVRDLPPLFIKFKELLRQSYIKAVNCGYTTSIRIEPVCVWVTGPPGIGKSHMRTMVCNKLMKSIGKETNYNDTFVFSPGVKHWTGAKNMNIVVFDDFGTVEGTTIETDIQDFMRLISDARFVPEQAAIEDKGVPLAPTLVYVNCNESHPQYNQVRSSGAFLRRRHKVVNVECSPDFKFKDVNQDGALAWIKERVTEANPYPHLVFSFVDKYNHETFGRHLTFPEYIQQLTEWFVEEYNDHYLQYRSKLKNQEDDFIPDEASPLAVILDNLLLKTAETLDVKEKTTFMARVKKVYSHSLQATDEALKQAKSWFSALAGSQTDQSVLNAAAAEAIDLTTTVVEPSAHCSKDEDPMFSEMPIETPAGFDVKIYKGTAEEAAEIVLLNKSKFHPQCPHTCEYLSWCTIEKNSKLILDKDCLPVILKDCPGKSSCRLRDAANFKRLSLIVPNEIIEQLCYQLHGDKSIPKPLYDEVSYALIHEKQTLREKFFNCIEEIKWGKVAISFLSLILSVILVLGFVIGTWGLIRLYQGKPFLPWAKSSTGPPAYEEDASHLFAKNLYRGSPVSEIVAVKNNIGVSKVGEGEETPMSELVPSGDNIQSKPRQTTGIKAKEFVGELIGSGDQPQSSKVGQPGVRPKAFTPEMSSHVLPLFSDATCYLVLDGIDRNTEEEIKGFTMRCFALKGNYIIVLKHYLAKISRTRIEHLWYVDGQGSVKVELDFDKCKIIPFAKSEIAILDHGNKISKHRDMTKHFATEQETRLMSNSVTIVEKALGMPVALHKVRVEYTKDLDYIDAGVTHQIPEAFKYQWHNPGRCMSFLVMQASQPKIVGFHIAGCNGWGAAEPIIMESFAGLEDLSPVPLQSEMMSSTDFPRVVLNSHLLAEGIVAQKYAARPAEKSMIAPSVIHGYMPISTAPGPLTTGQTGGKFSPLITGVDKHGHPPSGFPTDLLNRAAADLRATYKHSCPSVITQVGVKTIEDAVIGVPGLEGYQGMELSTSEGFPYIATRPPGATNKRYQFEIEVDEKGNRKLVKLDDKVLKIMEEKTELRRQGLIPPTVFIDCLKDARIKLKNINVPGKVRIFSISPTDFTIQFRQYFMDILASQKVNRFKNEHMVGVNVHGLEWSLLARELQSKGPKILCGDYSNFGPGLDAEVVEKVFEIWAEWYRWHGDDSDENYIIRRVMGEELRHALHLCINVLYRSLCGSPSGAPCTVNINNDVNRIYIRMAWLACWADDPLMSNFVAMRKHISYFVYGDDVIINVSDVAAERFNNEFLQQFFAKYGIKYTDELKGEQIRKWCSLSESSFLKHHFIPHPCRTGIFTAGLDADSLYDTANWCHKKADLITASKQTTCDALMLAYGRGPDFFEEMRRKLITAWSNKVPGEPLTLYTYDEMDRIRFGYALNYVILDLDSAIKKEREYRASCKRQIELASGLTPIMFE